MSELYAAVLMIGVTLALGSVVAGAAVGLFGYATRGASLGASAAQESSEVQLSLVYSTTAPSASCPSYGGGQEGTALDIGLFDYGSAGFSPDGFVVNSSVIGGDFGSVAPGSLAQFVLPLGSCAHPSGQTLVAFDAAGDEVQIET